jgi:hypothetical protein
VAAKICPVSSLGRKPFGVTAKRIAVATITKSQADHCRNSVSHHKLQAELISADHALEEPLGNGEPSPVTLTGGRAQYTAAQHRCQRQRYETRNQDRARNCHGKFVQQPSDDSAHEQDAPPTLLQ